MSYWFLTKLRVFNFGVIIAVTLVHSLVLYHSFFGDPRKSTCLVGLLLNS
jgi:nitrogen fixation protein FixH